MIRSIILVSVVTAAIATGCKGETKTQDNPQMKADLDACLAAKKQKEDLNAQLIAEKAQGLKNGETSGSAAPQEFLVTINGDVVTIKPGGANTGNEPGPDAKIASALTSQFIDIVRKSRGSIQKCDEQTLKKRSDLAHQTMRVTVTASFAKQGTYRDATFQPSLGDTFDNCIHTIATHWALPATSPAITLQAPIDLKPS